MVEPGFLVYKPDEIEFVLGVGSGHQAVAISRADIEVSDTKLNLGGFLAGAAGRTGVALSVGAKTEFFRLGLTGLGIFALDHDRLTPSSSVRNVNAQLCCDKMIFSAKF